MSAPISRTALMEAAAGPVSRPPGGPFRVSLYDANGDCEVLKLPVDAKGDNALWTVGELKELLADRTPYALTDEDKAKIEAGRIQTAECDATKVEAGGIVLELGDRGSGRQKLKDAVVCEDDSEELWFEGIMRDGAFHDKRYRHNLLGPPAERFDMALLDDP